ncbi:hypothetical protein Tco_0584074 [Tanacetum coccineum]
MADANINAPEVLIAAASPPTWSNEQILPRNKWVPVGKSNCFLDVERTQANPIFKIVLDEQRFYLTKATLRDALQLPQGNNNFTSPPNANTIISFVNELGYPNVVRTLSGFVTNDMYQPGRALATIINLCLTRKTSAFKRPRAPVLQILWGVVNKANIYYAERLWEEFTQCIYSFIEDKMNLALHTEGKKKVNPLVIPGVCFGIPEVLIPNTLISENIQSATYYPEYVAKVAKYQRYLAGEVVSNDEAPATKPAKGAKPKTTKKPKPQSPKTAPVSKKRKLQSTLQLVDKFIDEGVPADEPRFSDEEADMRKAVEESLKDAYVAPRGPLPLVVIREPEPVKYEPLPEVQGKGKDKFGEEQAAQAGSDPGKQVEDQAGSDPSKQVEGQALVAADSQIQPSHVVHAGPNLEHMNLEENLKLPTEGEVRLEEPVSSVGTLSSLQNLDKEDEPEKTNTEAEFQSMVTVPIHQDTPPVPLMTTPVMDITDP